LTWRSGALQEAWTFTSDWKPVPSSIAGWEPVFQPALAAGSLAVPGAGGTPFRVSRAPGEAVARVEPVGAPAAGRTGDAGGRLAADNSGALWYDALALDASGSVSGAWLVKIAADGTASKAAFSTLVPGAPASSDPCEVSFLAIDLPWPPTPTATPRTLP